MDSAAVLSALRAEMPDVLLAVDFDGTLAPLVPDPQQSRPVDGAIDVLAELARQGASVAIVTGRDAQTAIRLGGVAHIPGLAVAGLYGLETWHDGELDTPDTPPALEELQRRLPDLLREQHADPAVWIEDKRLSLVVHARRADDPAAALQPLRGPIAALADELDLEVHPGRDVLELRLPGYDKAGALRRLAGAHRGVVYIGDDLGDLPAFAEIKALRAHGRVAYGVAVLASGVDEVARAADLTVAHPDDVVRLLRRLAG